MKCYEVHVRYSNQNGYSAFFKADLDTPNDLEITREATNQGVIEEDDFGFVDYAVEITEGEFKEALGL